MVLTVTAAPAEAQRYALSQARLIVKPGVTYFNQRFNETDGRLAADMKVFKVLRYANPYAMQRMTQHRQFDVNAFSTDVAFLDWFTLTEIEEIVSDLPSFIETVSPANFPPVFVEEELESVARIWNLNGHRFGAFRRLFVRYALTFVPSSAAAERVFSILKRFFGTDQNSALEDYIEYAVMAAFNRLGMF